MDDPVDIEQLQVLVKHHREHLGLSLRAAAEESGVPFNTLARVEKGHLPDLANFRRLVLWLGLSPERFFQPSMFRVENTPEVIASRLAQDPNLTPAAAETIADVVRELYGNLVLKDREVTVHLRAAKTFTPDAARLLGEILVEIQERLQSGPTGPRHVM
ncbi:helix-turn-helix domain-containing protein [Actinomadura soli]|uniref:helix-turn-helix domain-containing protein n=1 Tax=Actinomadura soli TaxID=2508997 RepID=UPI001486F0DF|nr:helix-turn-helix transcriptional regulator [Actinomadura soli]